MVKKLVPVIVVLLAVIVLALSYRLTPIPRQPGIKIDLVGFALSAIAIALMLLGFNNLQTWGLLVAEDGAPFSVLGLSPAPILIILGILFGQAFFFWSHRRVAGGKRPLLAMEVLDSDEEKNAVKARLDALAGTTDGFALAEMDMEQRREGELLGLNQSGLPPLRVASLSRPSHRELSVKARAIAEQLVDDSGHLKPELTGLEHEMTQGWLQRVGAGEVLAVDADA